MVVVLAALAALLVCTLAGFAAWSATIAIRLAELPGVLERNKIVLLD
jgi:hypothetical protein